ncbi:PE family protein [Mycobacterium kansasii]|uniref:PE family protein n=1 Tax=Mycobacterium kansasii TaxID=1768 RepID=A0A1V3XEW6_MYCKA|nr:PE family protein [Mycobacterium kansasii]
MAGVLVAPEILTATAADLAGIGSTLEAANRAAAASTSRVLAAGADEVSEAIADLLSGYARQYQALSTSMAGFHQQFVQTLASGGGSYAAAETTNAARCRPSSSRCSP